MILLFNIIYNYLIIYLSQLIFYKFIFLFKFLNRNTYKYQNVILLLHFIIINRKYN